MKVYFIKNNGIIEFSNCVKFTEIFNKKIKELGHDKEIVFFPIPKEFEILSCDHEGDISQLDFEEVNKFYEEMNDIKIT
jgi:hypothetical protein